MKKNLIISLTIALSSAALLPASGASAKFLEGDGTTTAPSVERSGKALSANELIVVDAFRSEEALSKAAAFVGVDRAGAMPVLTEVRNAILAP